MRILVIEDDHATSEYIVRGLTQEGQTVEVAQTGKDGLFLALSPDGLTIVRALRAQPAEQRRRTEPLFKQLNLLADRACVTPSSAAGSLKLLRQAAVSKALPALKAEEGCVAEGWGAVT